MSLNIYTITDWISDNKGKFLSIILALINFAISYHSLGIYGVYRMFSFLIIVLSFIWFGEYWGRMRAGFLIQKETPGIFMVFIGWVLLVIPIISTVIRWVLNKY